MNLRNLVLGNYRLYLFAVKLLNIRNIFSNSRNIKGKDNKIIKHNSVLLRGVRIKIIGKGNLIILKKGSRLRNVFIEIIGNYNQILISENVAFYEKGYFLIEGERSVIDIGQGSTFGSSSIAAGESNTKILIGKDCMFSRKTSMNTSDLHSIIDFSTNSRINYPKDIIIGDHVWVGYMASILKGAEIGDNCVIAQKALVPGKSFEKNSILAGLPAKIIKSNITWSRNQL